MDFMNSVTWGWGAFNSVWGKTQVEMTETFNVNTDKQKNVMYYGRHNLQHAASTQAQKEKKLILRLWAWSLW